MCNFRTTNNIFVAPFPGCRRYTVLHWGLCFYYIWWLWSFFWGYLHFHPCHGDNCCWHASFCHWFHWLLCHHSRKPLRPGHGKLESDTPHFNIYRAAFYTETFLIVLDFSTVLSSAATGLRYRGGCSGARVYLQSQGNLEIIKWHVHVGSLAVSLLKHIFFFSQRSRLWWITLFRKYIMNIKAPTQTLQAGPLTMCSDK